MKQNKGIAPVAILLILLGVLVVGGVAYYSSKNSVPKNELNNNSNYSPTVNQNQSIGASDNPSISNAKVVAEWKSMPSSSLLAISSKENIYLEPDFGISLIETVDLTGDGLDEGIFGGNGGNNGLSFIMIKDTGGKNFVAKQKNKDGTINPVQLLSVGRVMVQEGYELLPSEHGFYTASLSYDEATEKFKCNTNGVSAYSWNSSSKLFEWNQALTNQWQKDLCSDMKISEKNITNLSTKECQSEFCIDDLPPTEIVSTKSTTYESIGISEKELESLVTKNLGGGCGPETISQICSQKRTIEIIKADLKINGVLYKNVSLVVATYYGLYDDSASNQKKISKIYKDASGDGLWRLSKPYITWTCWPGRGHSEFNTQSCS